MRGPPSRFPTVVGDPVLPYERLPMSTVSGGSGSNTSARSGDDLPELHSDEHLEQARDEFEMERLSDADREQIEEEAKTESAPDGTVMSWAMTLFGTAVGAGILFLPLDAGTFGFWPLIIATLFIGPLVFFSHRTYARIVSGSPIPGMDVLQVVTALTGRKRGFATALVYWLAVYPTVLIYAISITNTLESFIINQFEGPEISRWILAPICVGVLTGAFALGQKITLAIANFLVYPLIIALAGVSLYLIPRWDIESFMSYEADTPLWQSLLLILPVLVFSFSHMAALSKLALDVQKNHDGDVAATENDVTKIELTAVIALVLFTMFFVWSCAFALGADGLDEAAEQNIPVLSYLANETATPLLAWLSPIVAICAIASSYFGHMLGTEEGTTYLLRVAAPNFAQRVNENVLRWMINIFVFVTGTVIAVFNPSIMTLISVVGGVFVAFLVYLVPSLLFRKATAFKHYANRPDTIFVGLMGVVIVCVTLWDMVR